MKFLINGLFILFIMMSCSKNKSENICSAQTFSFFNEAGNDLFDQNISGHLDVKDLKAFKLSGEELNIINGKFDDVYQFDIGINQGDFTSIIQIGDITTDTITAKYKEKGNSYYIYQVYYNGKLVITNEEPTNCGDGRVVDVIIKSD
ncbi:MAG: hypothetical protein B7C24_01245 [Bacteroidetes bacterium 4572_77]|nr:MAG: hypothetical protein B7C24_01245 [Bacteroidetes bacterium 4572_77]